MNAKYILILRVVWCSCALLSTTVNAEETEQLQSTNKTPIPSKAVSNEEEIPIDRRTGFSNELLQISAYYGNNVTPIVNNEENDILYLNSQLTNHDKKNLLKVAYSKKRLHQIQSGHNYHLNLTKFIQPPSHPGWNNEYLQSSELVTNKIWNGGIRSLDNLEHIFIALREHPNSYLERISNLSQKLEPYHSKASLIDWFCLVTKTPDAGMQRIMIAEVPLPILMMINPDAHQYIRKRVAAVIDAILSLSESENLEDQKLAKAILMNLSERGSGCPDSAIVGLEEAENQLTAHSLRNDMPALLEAGITELKRQILQEELCGYGSENIEAYLYHTILLNDYIGLGSYTTDLLFAEVVCAVSFETALSKIFDQIDIERVLSFFESWNPWIENCTNINPQEIYSQEVEKIDIDDPEFANKEQSILLEIETFRKSTARKKAAELLSSTGYIRETPYYTPPKEMHFNTLAP